MMSHEDLLTFLKGSFLSEPIQEVVDQLISPYFPCEKIKLDYQHWIEKYDQLLEKCEQTEKSRHEQLSLLEKRYVDLNNMFQSLQEENERFKIELSMKSANIISETHWRQRMSFFLAFFPRLPLQITKSDLQFICCNVTFPEIQSPFIPLHPAVVQIKKKQFLELPEAEQKAIRELCWLLKKHYSLMIHPDMTSLLVR